MTQTQSRDWQKDMEMCERYQRDEGWSRRDLIAEQPQMTMYWLKEYAYESEKKDQYWAWHLDEEKRANDAEAREQLLKEAIEKIIPYVPDLTREAFGLNTFLSTLYPDTPAPKEGSQ